MRKFTISVLCLNNVNLTKECVDSVIRHTHEDFELVLTDNGSFDNGETLALLKQYLASYTNVRLILHKQNVGFILGHNYAYEKFSNPYFVILNNDVIVCENWLTELYNKMVKDNLAQVGAFIDGVTCNQIDRNGNSYCAGYSDSPDYIEASCMMVDTKVIKTLRTTLFDPEYKLAYFEDSDLSFTLRSTGYKIGHVELPLTHKVAATSTMKLKEDLHGYWLLNRERWKKKWLTYVQQNKEGRILVKRNGALGDVLWTTAILRELKRKYPFAEIDFLTSSSCSGVLENNPNVNTVYVRPSYLREEKYSTIIDLNMCYENNPETLLVTAFANEANVDMQTKYPEFFPDKHAEDSLSKKVANLLDYVVVHFEPANWVGRNLPEKTCNKVVQHLIDLGYHVVKVGTSDILNVGETHNLVGKLNFSELAVLIRDAKLFLGLDSFPSVLALAMRCPSVIIFGCINPKYRIPAEFNNVIPVNNRKLGCLGCHHFIYRDSGAITLNTCLRTDQKEKCMLELPIESIIDAISACIGGSQ